MLHPNPGRSILVLHPHLTKSRNTFHVISAFLILALCLIWGHLSRALSHLGSVVWKCLQLALSLLMYPKEFTKQIKGCRGFHQEGNQ